MKRLFLGIICLTVPLLPFVYVPAFLGPLRISGLWFGFVTALYGVGIVFVALNIVLAETSAAFKFRWTLLALCLGLVFLPIYWIKYVRPSRSAPSEND